MKLSEFKPRLKVIVKEGFSNMNPGEYVVKIDKGGLYLRCQNGKQYLKEITQNGEVRGIEVSS